MKPIIDLSNPRNRVIVALDVNTLKEVKHYVELLSPYVGMFKVGFELIHSVGGPQVVEVIHNAGGKVFYDCKLHDIPETMKKSAQAIASMGVAVFNVHASAGVKAMKMVMEVCGDSQVAAVSVLTSLSNEECNDIYHNSSQVKVKDFAYMMVEAGVPVIISSAGEAVMVKNIIKTKNLLTITPGIRPLWSVTDDQDKKKVMTPKNAILEGCDMLVIGRPILKPENNEEGYRDSVTAVQAIVAEITEGLKLKKCDFCELLIDIK